MIKENGKVIENKEVSPGIFDIKIKVSTAKAALPGQFVNIYLRDKTRLLPRPISICRINKEEETIRLLYRVCGDGTREIKTYKPGDIISLLSPLGKGYLREDGFVGFTHLLKEKEERDIIVLLSGGGIGIPPLLETGAALKEKHPDIKIISTLGFRDKNTFLTEEFMEFSRVFISTENGSVGEKGNVLDIIKNKKIEPDIIYSCGPKVMLSAINDYAKEEKIPIFVSMEERMACGVGACLSCVTKGKRRVCADGPVFNGEDVL